MRDSDKRTLRQKVKINPRESKNITCKFCSSIFTSKDYRRKFCNEKCFRLFQRKVDRPSKEVLETEIQSTSWVDLGDNAVRKWAKNYNIL